MAYAGPPQDGPGTSGRGEYKVLVVTELKKADLVTFRNTLLTS